MKMDESQLVAAIEQHEADSISRGRLQEDRLEALDYYLGRPMGNEVEGRSQVIARQVWDTVEWLKPQLADIFTSGEEVVAFQPRGPEDVKAAEQETDYVNWQVTQKNNWFEIFYSWTHDALVQKNGYVIAYWDDEEDKTREKYSGLTPEEFARLSQDGGIEFISQEQAESVGPDGMPSIMLSCEIERTRPRNVVRIENVPPENVRVSQSARGLSLQDPRLPFVEHVEMKSISELRAEGFDIPDDISDGGSDDDLMAEARRDEYTPFRDSDGQESDPSMRMVRVRHVWIRTDYDGDGRAELRDVIVVGTTVLQNEETDAVNLVALCPTPLPHTHTGLSVADAVMDLQRIQTALLRGALDNQYLANNGRYGVDENRVNLDDMLDSRPGGVVRVDGAPGESLFPLTHPATGNVAVPMMEYVDRLAQKRTGVNEQNQGLDPNALNKTATGAQLLLSASQQRIKFIARIFAETGIKALFQLVHQLTLQNSRQQQIVELRGEWVPIDPRQWTKRTDMVISIALGNGDRVQQLAFLAQMRQWQMELMPMGLATPMHILNTMTRATKAAGYKDPSEYWNDPQKNPPPPPGPPPEVQMEQIKQQGKMAEIQAAQQYDVMRFQAEQVTTAKRDEQQAMLKQRETELSLQLQAANDERDAQRERERDARDYELKMVEMQVKERLEAERLAFERYKADLDAQVKLQVAEMQRKTSLDTANMSAQASLTGARIGADSKEKQNAHASSRK